MGTALLRIPPRGREKGRAGKKTAPVSPASAEKENERQISARSPGDSAKGDREENSAFGSDQRTENASERETVEMLSGNDTIPPPKEGDREKRDPKLVEELEKKGGSTEPMGEIKLYALRVGVSRGAKTSGEGTPITRT